MEGEAANGPSGPSGASGPSDSFEWDEVKDLTSLPRNELKRQLEVFSAEEREVSYRRRVLQGRIDLIRSELVRRGSFSVSPEELAGALLGGSPDPAYGGPAGDPEEPAEEPDGAEGPESAGDTNGGAG